MFTIQTTGWRVFKKMQVYKLRIECGELTYIPITIADKLAYPKFSVAHKVKYIILKHQANVRLPAKFNSEIERGLITNF